MTGSDTRNAVNKLPPRTLVVVAAALTRADGRVLLQQRLPDKAHPGLWEFPGGKVELHEEPETALARELAEELGISVDPVALVPATFVTAAMGNRHLLLLLYRAHSWQGEARPLEAGALAWVFPADMAGWPMSPADHPLAAHLARAWPPADA